MVAQATECRQVTLSPVQRMQLREIKARFASPGSVSTIRQRAALCRELRFSDARLSLLLQAWRQQLLGLPVIRSKEAEGVILRACVDTGKISSAEARRICGTSYRQVRGHLLRAGLIQACGTLLEPTPGGIAKVIALRFDGRSRWLDVILRYRKMISWIHRMDCIEKTDRWVAPTLSAVVSAPFRGGGSESAREKRARLLAAMAPAGMHETAPDSTTDATPGGILRLTDAGRDYLARPLVRG